MDNNFLSRISVKDNKILIDNSEEKAIDNDNIEVLNLPFKLYGKLKKVRYFSDLIALIEAEDIIYQFYGFDEEEIKEIRDALSMYLKEELEIESKSDNDITVQSQSNTNVSSDRDLNENHPQDPLNATYHLLNLPAYYNQYFKKANINTIKDVIEKLNVLKDLEGFGKSKYKALLEAINEYTNGMSVASESKIFTRDSLIKELPYSDALKDAFDNLNIKTINDLLENKEKLNLIEGLVHKDRNDIIQIATDSLRLDINVNNINLWCQNVIPFGESTLYFSNLKIYIFDEDIHKLNINLALEKNMKENDISTFSDLINFFKNDSTKFKNVGKHKIKALKQSFVDYIRINGIDDETILKKKQCERTILKALEDTHFDGMIIDDVLAMAKEKFPSENVNSVIDDLLNHKKIFIYDTNKFFIQYPTFGQAIYNMESGTIKDILYCRLDGMSLEDISKNYQCTRERIRQLQQKGIDELCKDASGKIVRYFKEDRFKYIYETYDIPKPDFIEIFGIKERCYNYLAFRYIKGKKNINDAIQDENIFPRLRTLIQRFTYKDFVSINGAMVQRKGISLFRYFVKENLKVTKHIDEIKKEFKDFLSIYAPEFIDEISNGRLLIARLYEMDNVLTKPGKKFIYYEFANYDFKPLLNTIDLPSYDTLEISTELFMNLYSDLMIKYEIKDKYELYGILKQLYEKNPDSRISFRRTPSIVVGQINRRQFLLNILREAGKPLNGVELADLIYEKTGFDKRMIPTPQWVGLIDDKKIDGLYSYAKTLIPFTNDEIDFFKSLLKDDIYKIDFVEKEYLKQFPGGNVELKFETSNFKKVGYVMGSGYLLSAKYNMVTYVKSLFNNGVLNNKDLINFKDINAMNVCIDKLQAQNKIFKFDKSGDFITLEKLSTRGITQDDIAEFVDSVKDFVSQDEFFTIYSLRNHGFTSKLDFLGFDDTFYENLLLGKKVFYVNPFNNYDVFNKSIAVNKKNLLSSIINERQKIETQDLLVYLKDEFGLSFEKEDVVYVFNNDKIYYDSIMDAFYMSYELYLEEI